MVRSFGTVARVGIIALGVDGLSMHEVSGVSFDSTRQRLEVDFPSLSRFAHFLPIWTLVFFFHIEIRD